MGARTGRHVVYFAIPPPPEAAAWARALLDGLRAVHAFTARPVPAERLHVPLNAVGAFLRPPGPVIDKARDTAATVRAAPFTVTFNRIGTWPAGDNPGVVLSGEAGVIGVNGLYSTLHRALVRSGMAPRRQAEIAPHLTLVYDRVQVPQAVVEPVSWTVDEFVLIYAVHGEGRFDVVGRWPLAG